MFFRALLGLEIDETVFQHFLERAGIFLVTALVAR